MFAHRFRRILLSQDVFKISSTLLELFTHRLLSLEIGLHLVAWDRDLATKDTCHPPLPLHVPIAMKISTVIPPLSLQDAILLYQAKKNQADVRGLTSLGGMIAAPPQGNR